MKRPGMIVIDEVQSYLHLQAAERESRDALRKQLAKLTAGTKPAPPSPCRSGHRPEYDKTPDFPGVSFCSRSGA